MADCRFCNVFDPKIPLIKYGVRHYAHAECFLKRKGLDGLRKLPLFQLESFPIMTVLKVGIAPILGALIGEKRRAIAKRELPDE